MQPFIAYHNTEKMGRELHEGNALSLLTNKPAEQAGCRVSEGGL